MMIKTIPISKILYDIFDIMKIDEAIPRTGMIGSLPIEKGTLNPSFIGFLYL